eukprot:4607586-Alexandrium_andersonii.AAC.1
MAAAAIGIRAWAFRRARASRTITDVKCERRGCEAKRVGGMKFEACTAQGGKRLRKREALRETPRERKKNV